jgi:predicted DNA-binding transcriptional regulator YafY
MCNQVYLSTVRECIVTKQRARFDYDGETVVADVYLLGQARKGAYVVIAWCAQPTEGWRFFRYSMIKDFRVAGPMESFQEDFDPYHSGLMTVDTQLCPPVLQHALGH